VDEPTQWWEFHQKDIQSDGGWCSGISISMQHTFREGTHTAQQAFDTMCDVLQNHHRHGGSWSHLQRTAGLFYKAPVVSNFTVKKNKPIRVITQVLNIGWFTYAPLWSYATWAAAGGGFANHACLLYSTASELVLLEPNWGVALWAGKTLPAQKRDAITMVNEMILWGYLKTGQRRTGWVVNFFDYSGKSYTEATRDLV